ncbi:MAG TPA: heme ABC exporter ATP-binding protein CcmA [Thermoplasmata archaeon]|nr:heme ABC exporter ATP-binding protein CcmA [Thermoplasmata archaeon]
MSAPSLESSGSGPAIECRGVSAGYDGSRVLRHISFQITEPAIYVVLGPNGAGKTTLLRTLSGILEPYEGTIQIDGKTLDRSSAGTRVHYLSHVDGIPDGLRVREALNFYALVERAGRSDVERVLDLLEIRPLAEHYVSQLSAGQRKRVSIARVFLRERAIYLLDEPTSNLDPKVASEIRTLILNLSRKRVVLYSSHNLYEAREIGRYVMAIRDGQIALFGRIDDLRSSHFVVGIRALEPSNALAELPRRGDYYLKELPGPEAVPDLLRTLESQGVRIREVREMGNPLEELFADAPDELTRA